MLLQEICHIFRSHFPFGPMLCAAGSGGSSTSAAGMAAARRRAGEQSQKWQVMFPDPGLTELRNFSYWVFYCVWKWELSVQSVRPLAPLARRWTKTVWGRMSSSRRFSTGQRWSRVQHLTDVHGLPFWIRIIALFEIWFRVWWKKKKKTSQRQSLSPSPFSLPGLYLFVCKCHSRERAETACLNGADGSIPPDLGARVGFDQPREKNVNICLPLHGKRPIIIFSSASPSCSQTKPPSCRLCCLHHFPPPLHLWYANGRTERFCVAEKDLWAHSLGQQSQLLHWGSACCARSLMPRDFPPPRASFFQKKNKTVELTIWLSWCPET